MLNVGTGSGSNEPAEKSVVAVEPAREMISQRPAGAAPVVRTVAESLSFPDGCLDAATALLTVHHWGDSPAGLAETRRVTTGPIVVLTFDREVHERQRFVADYLPAMAGVDEDHIRWTEVADALGSGNVEIVEVAHDRLRRLLPRMVALSGGLPRSRSACWDLRVRAAPPATVSRMPWHVLPRTSRPAPGTGSAGTFSIWKRSTPVTVSPSLPACLPVDSFGWFGRCHGAPHGRIDVVEEAPLVEPEEEEQ